MADFQLTPLETFVCAHALKRSLAEFGDDAVLQSALNKLDAAFQEAQLETPGLAERVEAHLALLERGAAMKAADPVERSARRDERLRKLGLRPRVRENPDDVGYFT